MPKASTTKLKRKSRRKPTFNAQAFLDSAGIARRIVEFGKSQKIYVRGDPAKNVLYIQKGGIKLSVVNEVGKEAVFAILGPGDFFGEGVLQHRMFAREQRLRSHPRPYSLLRKTR
jgi:CRP-like cAMP-binding protein